ncbi:acylphosphatase [[Eubacterium] cellulosolvens]
MASIRIHVYVKGRVQGVFFRYETSRVAKENNVKGWVRNRFDGSVEAVFEGEKGDVEKVVVYCRRGPPGADVRDIQVVEEPWQGEFKDFKIVY